MVSEIFFVAEDSREGGFEAKALKYSIFTEGNSFDELKENIKDAVTTHFDADGMPKLIRLHYVKEEVIAI